MTNNNISNNPPEYPGMNFTRLKQEAISFIQDLGGNNWTDYNIHDPGVTILEVLCYVITDLSYRLNFEMKDLWSTNPSNQNEIIQFYTAKQILTVNPLTIDDYRKLLMDIDEVKNAQLTVSNFSFSSKPQIYTKNNTLNINSIDSDSAQNNQEIFPRGVYQITIELHELDSDEPYKDSVKEKVLQRLNDHRNVCEYFNLHNIGFFEHEEVTVTAEINIEENADEEEVIKKVYSELYNYICPNVKFYSLEELENKGRKTEEIFQGCSLKHGFIDDEEFDSMSPKSVLYTSDLIERFLSIQEVKSIKSITLQSQHSGEQNFQLPLLHNHLALISNNTSITYFKMNSTIQDTKTYADFKDSEDSEKSEDSENSENSEESREDDISPPIGNYRELSYYESIQNDFPSNYSIGEFGTSSSSNTTQKAWSKQLQGYLMFFDQILANYFSQLEHAKILFSLNQQEGDKTYSTQNISTFPNADNILNFNDEDIQNLWLNQIDDLDRKNRFLDYLIAQFAEKLTTSFSSFGLKDKLEYKKEQLNQLITNKTKFLSFYPQISSYRAKALNLTSSQVVNSDNISGLKKRISLLLGIYDKRKDFYLVEHILLLIPYIKCDEDLKVKNLKLDEKFGEDPFSFQISFIFPQELSQKLGGENFRQRTSHVINSEIPAHINPYIYWLNSDKMSKFKCYYNILLHQIFNNDYTIPNICPHSEEKCTEINTNANVSREIMNILFRDNKIEIYS